MRRTCASLLSALDVHPRVAMRILRHSKIAVTMEIYTEVPDDITREALRRLGEPHPDPYYAALSRYAQTLDPAPAHQGEAAMRNMAAEQEAVRRGPDSPGVFGVSC